MDTRVIRSRQTESLNGIRSTVKCQHAEAKLGVAGGIDAAGRDQ